MVPEKLIKKLSKVKNDITEKINVLEANLSDQSRVAKLKKSTKQLVEQKIEELKNTLNRIEDLLDRLKSLKS